MLWGRKKQKIEAILDVGYIPDISRINPDLGDSENQENAGVTNEASANEETEVKSDVSKEDPKKEKAEESEKGET